MKPPSMLVNLNWNNKQGGRNKQACLCHNIIVHMGRPPLPLLVASMVRKPSGHIDNIYIVTGHKPEC